MKPGVLHAISTCSSVHVAPSPARMSFQCSGGTKLGVISLLAVAATYFLAKPASTGECTSSAVPAAPSHDQVALQRLRRELATRKRQLQRVLSVEEPECDALDEHACLKPKYHVSAMLSASGVTCQVPPAPPLTCLPQGDSNPRLQGSSRLHSRCGTRPKSLHYASQHTGRKCPSRQH